MWFKEQLVMYKMIQKYSIELFDRKTFIHIIVTRETFWDSIDDEKFLLSIEGGSIYLLHARRIIIKYSMKQTTSVQTNQWDLITS